MKFSTTFTVTFLYLCFVVMNISCKQKDQQTTNDVVYYYPQKNVYYDQQEGNYYYSLNGAATWDSLHIEKPVAVSVLGKQVPLKRTDESIWIDNEIHRKTYNGVLINVINNETISLSKADSIRRIKPVVVVKPKPPVVEKEEPPKKGLKKFFDKLFGKKKKPTNEEEKQ